MNLQGTGVWSMLDGMVPRARIALIIALAVLGPLTEGLGLILLVPILQLAQGEGSAGRGPDWLQSLGQSTSLSALLVIFVLLIALRTMLVQWRKIAETSISLAVGDRLRAEIFAALMAANWRYLSRQRPGAQLASIFEAVARARNAMSLMMGLCASLVTMLIMLGIGMLIAPLPSLALGASGVLILAAYSGLRRRAMSEGIRLGEAYGQAYDFYSSRLGVLRMIKSFGTQERERATADSLAQRVRELDLSYQRGVALGQFTLQVSAAAALALAVWLAIEWWHTPLSIVLPMIALFARSVPLLGIVQTNWQQYGHNRPAIQEIGMLLAEAKAQAETPAAESVASPNFDREIALQDVFLRHEGRDAAALDGFSLSFPKGSTTFVTGPSGSGKSTLADLLAGLVQPDAGHLTIDGVVLDGSALSAWRARVAYVQQEPVLFDASIRENLAWAAPDADEAALVEALSKASAQFVFALPAGLDTRVGTGGRQLSGGECQRIVLARALLRDPVLLILDEATSALDAENEAAINEAIRALKGAITIVVLGHGGKLAELADRILRLENGRLVG